MKKEGFMCNAHNHPPGCTCGWGGASYSSFGQGYSPKIFKTTPRLAPQIPNFSGFASSYTKPNARCPVCGVPVFFYASENGGRVFFDSLGPPWPKHPCTDRTGSAIFSNNVIGATLSQVKHQPPEHSNECWKEVSSFFFSVDEYEGYRHKIVAELDGRKYAFFTYFKIEEGQPDFVFVRDLKNGKYVFELMYFGKNHQEEIMTKKLLAIYDSRATRYINIDQ